MATTTPNFGWPVPTSTDLVKDGATAIEALGDGVDASLVDLKGGTTGQVLAKTSATDLDFTWVTTDDANAIQNSIVDAKGDLIGATAADTPARLAVGADNYFLQAASGQATGLQWGGAYTAYTPTLTNVTLGNGTRVGRYLRVGNLCHVEFSFTLGSTSAVAGSLVFSLPFNANLAAFRTKGAATLYDSGTQVLMGNSFINAANTCAVTAIGTSLTTMSEVGLSATVPFTWTTGDEISVFLVYEVA